MNRSDYLSLTLIRHAQSKFNEAEAEEGFEKTQFNPILIDPEITDVGVKQTQVVFEQLKSKPYDVVLVSPLKRALITATNIFRENCGNPKFIAVPLLTEQLVCSGEIGSNFYELTRTFKHVDFSLVNQLKRPEYWYLDCLQEENWTDSILQEANELGITEPNKVGEFVLAKLKIRPELLETLEKLAKRAQEAKDAIKRIVAEQGPEKRYAIVTHQCLLEELTKSQERPGMVFANCQIEEFILE